VFAALLSEMAAQGGRQRYITVGETGCMVRAAAEPFELFDVKLALGSSVGLGLGLASSRSGQRVVALVGDSCFFHSDWNALPQAVATDANLFLVVLENLVAAQTGGQPHPGSPRDVAGRPNPRPTSIAQVMAATGIKPTEVNAHDGEQLRLAIGSGLRAPGLAAAIVAAPCPRYSQEDG